MPSKIEWTDEVWNPTVGCAKVSDGCDNCYAIRVAHRQLTPTHEGLTIARHGQVDWTGEVRMVTDHGRLEQPLRWKRPRRVFVDSMSDLFHPQVTPEFLVRVFGVMARADKHTFQILTKRPARMSMLLAERAFGAAVFNDVARDGEPLWFRWPLPNVWLGVSVEDAVWARRRISAVRRTPAALRFLSIEPLLADVGPLDLRGIGWVIVGGESGPGARPMELEWVRRIRDQCFADQVPFFFKQTGSVLARQLELVSKKGDDMAEFPVDLQRREFPTVSR